MSELDPRIRGGVPSPEVGGDHFMDSGHFMSGLTEGRGRLLAFGFAGSGAMLGGAIAANVAPASEPVPTATQTININKTTIKVPGEAAVDFASSSVKIVANERSVSKAEYKADLEAGNCDFLTSEEMVEAGVKTAGHTGEEYDSRPSHLCDGDGDGDYDYRGECGNAVTVSTPSPAEAKANLWVNSLNKFKAKVRSVALAIDTEYCKVGESYSLSYARAKAVAYGKLVVKAGGGSKINVSQLGNKMSKFATSVKRRAFAKLNSKTTAVALAQAHCEDMGGEVVPPSEVPPTKVGIDGPGSGNGGQEGGTGSGGSGNTSPNSIACYDTATQNDGDQNPNTAGAPMWGTAKDQFDNCVGPAEPAIN